MEESKRIQTALVARFAYLHDKIRVARARRIFADVPAEKIGEVFDHAVKKMGFSMLSAITGLDLGSSLGVIYHLAGENGVTLNLSTNVPKEKPVIQTVTEYFPAADAYERELVDLFGMQVQGLPPGNRYPLCEDWPAGQYPLRKDWKPATSSTDAAQQGEGKNDV